MQKIVDNYQFDESTEVIQDGFQIYSARHIQTKQFFTLKKLNTKSNIDRDKYQSLLNQVSILKQLDHPNIIKCHKMLKTSNNIYLVYDFYPKINLQSLIAGGVKKISKKQKQDYIKQLCIAIKEMKRRGVVHLNLNPKCIYINENKTIKITGFFYGDLITAGKQATVHIVPPPNQYLAPQILQQQVGYFASDIYSLGKIILALELNKSQQNLLKVNDKQSESAEFIELISNMIKINPKQRVQISQVQIFFLKTNNSGKFSRTPSNSSSSARIIKGGSSKVIQSPASERRISPTKSYGSGSQKNNSQQQKSENSAQELNSRFKTFVLLIIRRRNLALFLLQMAQTCTKLIFDNNLSTVLSFLMMKKSYQVIHHLLKFLEGSQNDKQIVMTNEQKIEFFKTPDYFRICSIINKEYNFQKKWLSSTSVLILTELEKITDKFKNELQSDKLDQNYFKSCVNQFIAGSISNEAGFKMLDRKIITNLGMMSQILQLGTYEKVFEDLINETTVQLARQFIIVHLRQMEPEQVLQSLKKKVKQQ